MIIFDSNFLIAYLHENLNAPTDPSTNEPLAFYKERVETLFKELDRAGETIGIPTPVIAEIGIKSTKTAFEFIQILSNQSRIELLPFDYRAAVECSNFARTIWGDGKDKRIDSAPGEIWAKVKFDRQIAAIAKANQASAVYTWDSGVQSVCAYHGIPVITVFDLQIPESARQATLALPVPSVETESKQIH